MLNTLKKLAYGARMLLSRSGELSIVDIAGTPTQIRRGGEGPPFFYLHSALGETIWLPFLERWSKAFTVYAPAHPGFAQSQGFEGVATIEDLAFHYIDLLDTLGIEQAALGGVSLGGWLAAEIACRWPERVSRLWLCNAPGIWLDDCPLPDLFRAPSDAASVRRLLFHDPQGAAATMIIHEPEKQNDATRLAALQSLTVLARLLFERPQNHRLASRLHRVRCPTLILWGDHDRLVPPAYAHAWHRLLPQAQLHLIKECGHLPMFEKEAEFVDVVQRFCTAN